MKAILFLYITLIILTLCQEENPPYTLIKLSQENGAKCLDGSPPSIYFREGSGENKDKYIFFFQGGGWCGQETLDKTLANCVSRSKGDLGSSNNLPDKKNLSGFYNGDPSLNPNFYNYNVIMLNYCDGTGHQGYSQVPYHYDDSTIWFRGEENTNEAFNYTMENLGMKNAQQVIFGGYSAGGLACFTWSDELQARIQKQNKNTEVFAYCDSGVFMDFENMKTQTMKYQIQIQNFMLLSNASTPPINKQCVHAYPSQWWKCMFAQYLLEFVETKTLIAESQYDSWSLPNIIGISSTCLNGDDFTDKCTQEEIQQISEYRNYYLDTILELVQQKSNLGLWSPSCVKHCFDTNQTFYSDDWEIPAHSTWNLENVVQQFITEDGVSIRYDNEPYPSNLPCSRLLSKFIQESM